jgi:phosphoribosylformylglycinamidine synthase
MKKPLFIVIAGDGINCERETARAIELSGGAARIIHINDLLQSPQILTTADGLAVPGGFSFGDELGSGQIMALKIRHGLGDAFFDMVRRKKPVIGICNGFQMLVKLGLLPYPDAKDRIVALASNEQGRFIDCWVELNVEKSVCLWTEGLAKNRIRLPIRHGEGRIVFRDEKNYLHLVAQGLIPLTYTEDVNGSHGKIAALTDPSGIVLGLMPHPEAYMFQATHAGLQKDFMEKGDGALIFDNIMRIFAGREGKDEKRFD